MQELQHPQMETEYLVELAYLDLTCQDWTTYSELETYNCTNLIELYHLAQRNQSVLQDLEL